MINYNKLKISVCMLIAGAVATSVGVISFFDDATGDYDVPPEAAGGITAGGVALMAAGSALFFKSQAGKAKADAQELRPIVSHDAPLASSSSNNTVAKF